MQVLEPLDAFRALRSIILQGFVVEVLDSVLEAD